MHITLIIVVTTEDSQIPVSLILILDHNYIYNNNYRSNAKSKYNSASKTKGILWFVFHVYRVSCFVELPLDTNKKEEILLLCAVAVLIKGNAFYILLFMSDGLSRGNFMESYKFELKIEFNIVYFIRQGLKIW